MVGCWFVWWIVGLFVCVCVCLCACGCLFGCCFSSFCRACVGPTSLIVCKDERCVHASRVLSGGWPHQGIAVLSGVHVVCARGAVRHSTLVGQYVGSCVDSGWVDKVVALTRPSHTEGQRNRRPVKPLEGGVGYCVVSLFPFRFADGSGTPAVVLFAAGFPANCDAAFANMQIDIGHDMCFDMVCCNFFQEQMVLVPGHCCSRRRSQMPRQWAHAATRAIGREPGRFGRADDAPLRSASC